MKPQPPPRRGLRPLVEADIEIGAPVPWPVFDRAGKLLLGEGTVIACQAQWRALLARGLMAPAPASLLREPAAEAPRVLPAMQVLQDDVRVLHRALGAGECPDARAAVAPLAARLRALVERDADAALAAVQLALERDDHVARHLHAATVCLLAARSMALPPGDADSLLAAALTYDVALAPLADVLNAQASALTDAQRALVQAHTAAGHALLVAAGVVDAVWLDAVMHHHERLDGSGYPRGLVGDEVCTTTRMLAIADIYTAMVRPRAYRGAVHARQALRNIFLERGRAVDDALAAMLVKEVGVFPPGTLVRLANHEVGVVLRRGGDAAHPVVARVLTADGARASVPVPRDTSEPEWAIVETVSPERYPGALANAAALWGG